MLREGKIDKLLYKVKRLIPKSVFSFLAPIYHSLLAYAGAVIYRFPSRSLMVIGVTGTKGKSTTTYLISKILEGAGVKVAACGSLGFKIKEREWPNHLKMTMPGRMKLQKFMYEAKKAGCTHVVLEVTSEGIAQKRIKGIKFEIAVFTSLHREHLESHGSFEKYYASKQELFKSAKGVHVLNADDPHVELFNSFECRKKIFFGIKGGDIRADNINVQPHSASFTTYGTEVKLNFGGRFNVYNALAALTTAAMCDIDLPTAAPILSKIEGPQGRMQFIQKDPFYVVVDYAHTPDSLEAVYKTLKESVSEKSGRLICILGAAGGGRDKWKRPEFGALAAKYCDKIILTDEDPYEEDPRSIVKEIEKGLLEENKNASYSTQMDRREAINEAIRSAKPGDAVVVTGKGSEISMALAGGKKIPWSDAQICREALGL